MASLSNGKIVFYIDKRRQEFRVGRLNKKAAQATANKVDAILGYRGTGEPLPTSITEWLAKQDRWLLDAMAKAGLIESGGECSADEYFRQFNDRERDKHGRYWIINQNNTRQIFIRHFGTERTLRSITPEESQAFRVWMETEGRPVAKDKPKKGYAEATISGHVKIIRKLFKAAIKEKLVYTNPFADVVAGDQSNSSRHHEVAREVIQKIIDKAPNASWRALIALVRFGGLRTGSETRALKWEHVDWPANLIKVPGSKGRKKNRDGSKVVRWREIPIYPELKPYLEDAFNPENEFVLQDLTGTDANLYNELTRIMKKAGVPKYERLWHNMRATRDSELSASGIPDYAVAILMGNSAQTSRKHYKFIPKQLFASLSNASEGVPTIVPTKMPETAVLTRNGSQLIRVSPGVYLNPEEIESDQYT